MNAECSDYCYFKNIYDDMYIVGFYDARGEWRKISAYTLEIYAQIKVCYLNDGLARF